MRDQPPVSCVAVGGRQIPAEGGNIFDHFEVKLSLSGHPWKPTMYTVIPANVELTIASGTLSWRRGRKRPGSHMPIDRFLRSVADDLAEAGPSA